MFHKNLSELGWEKVKKRQLHRLPLVDEWIELIQMKSGYSVLDIGPGPGVFTQRYAKVVGITGKVTALEKSEEAIGYLTEELKQAESHIEIILGDAENAVVHDQGSFDIVMLTDVLHHTDSPARVLKNLYNNRHTKNARVLIAEFDPKSEGEIGPPLEKRLRENDLYDLLQHIGFTILSSGKQMFEHYYIIAIRNQRT
ncbi:class I SAM-dependent methyltransferase [Paenibacillus harenae]|uniref:class I SAM-dependent methyltransferase n=1 Tax=Paenibacillus harenae TaxID=306543 RepID=UPI0027D7F7D0|nr:class I SAM-dependent methyltransferase [Paenibacillus harenae]